MSDIMIAAPSADEPDYRAMFEASQQAHKDLLARVHRVATDMAEKHNLCSVVDEALLMIDPSLVPTAHTGFIRVIIEFRVDGDEESERVRFDENGDPTRKSRTVVADNACDVLSSWKNGYNLGDSLVEVHRIMPVE